MRGVLAGGGLRTLTPAMLAPELAQIEGADVFAWTDGDGPESAIDRVLDGIGTLLVADIAKQVRERRGTHLAALVEVDTPGQAFLASLGFRERGQRRTLMIRRAG